MSHVRVNQPPWGAREVVDGLGAMAWPRGEAVAALTDLVSGEVPGRRPLLLRSGRHALELALRSLDLPRHASVAVPAYVCPAVRQAVSAAGLRAVPVDTLPASFAPDRSVLDRMDPAAIVVPSTHAVDLWDEGLMSLAIPVIDDAAYLGALDALDRPPYGGRGTSGVWSFNHKALTGIGGGILWLAVDETGDEALHFPRARGPEALRFVELALRSVAGSRLPARLGGAAAPGSGSSDQGPVPAGAMSQLQAAVVRRQWSNRSTLTQRAIRHAQEIIGAGMAAGLTVVDGAAAQTLVHVVPFIHPAGPSETLAFRDQVHRGGVQTAEPYPVDGGAPNAVGLAGRLILVPCGAGLSDRDIERIVVTLRSM